MAAAFNIPFVSFGCTGNDLSNKVTYPTFSRSTGSWAQLATMMDVLTERMTWTTRIGIVTGTAHIMQSTAEEMRLELEKVTVTGHTQKTIVFYTLDSHSSSLEKIIDSVKDKVHIVLLLLYPPDMDAFLLKAHEQGVMNGEHAFITVDTELDMSRYVTLSTAYEGVLVLRVEDQTGATWNAFATDIITSFSDSRFDSYEHLQPTDSVSEVDIHAGLLHDAILAWAYGVNKTIGADLSKVDNGRAITSNIINMTFNGVTGRVSMDANGNRNMDYVVSIIQNYSFVDLFQYNRHTHVLTKQYEPSDADDWSDINWSGGRSTPPIGRPYCGWEGEHCKGSRLLRIIRAMGLVVFFLFVAIVAYFLYRGVRFYQELHAVEKWKVTGAEVRESRIGKQLASTRAHLRTRTMTSIAEEGQDKLYCDVAILKGVLCAVKRLNRQNVNASDTSILLEMKQMREMCHDNINPFLAAVCDYPNVCICMQYTQKGSLQDVLLNDSVNLTWDFKLSMACDIAQGLEYLHKSAFGSHGHLNSNNCVLDSRWVCKITDYGCSLFKKGHVKDQTEAKIYEDKLWVAPELLCMDERDVPDYGTKDGDVYAYGIILQEIVCKNSPYTIERETMRTKDIVGLVEAGQTPPFRPKIQSDGCTYEWDALIQLCWSEDPKMRPNCKCILRSLTDINGGKPLNITDNMVTMLEQHSEHLEELLAARNQEVLVEKRRVENFLYSMLPRSAADQLMEGESVSTKAYDNITVYHGMIADFTSIIAKSSPQQVTELVNRLQSLIDTCMNDARVLKLCSSGNTDIIVSGCPDEVVDHAKEVTLLALRVQREMQDFEIEYLPGVTPQLCIGIHTGPCVAGIVGLRMPRYCIFGETILIATELAATSEPLRIRVSDKTRELLGEVEFDYIPAPDLDKRGKATIASFYVMEEQPINL